MRSSGAELGGGRAERILQTRLGGSWALGGDFWLEVTAENLVSAGQRLSEDGVSQGGRLGHPAPEPAADGTESEWLQERRGPQVTQEPGALRELPGDRATPLAWLCSPVKAKP